MNSPPRIAILIKSDGGEEHVVNIEGRPHRVWEGTLPSGQQVHVVVQSIRPLPGATDAEANHVRAELAMYLDGLTHSNLRKMTRAEYIHAYGEEPPDG